MRGGALCLYSPEFHSVGISDSRKKPIIFATGQVNAVNAMMKALVDDDDIPSDAMPPAIQDYLVESAVLPSWADPERIQRGEQFFWRYGRAIVGIHRFKHLTC